MLSASSNVALQLLDGEFPLGDDRFHRIADRNDTNQPAAFDDGQVTDALVGHQRHTFFHRLLGTDGDYHRAHDLLDGDFPGRLACQNDLSRVIPLREDTFQLIDLEHQQCSDVLFGHQLEGVEDGGFRWHRPYLVSLTFQDLSGSHYRFTPWLIGFAAAPLNNIHQRREGARSIHVAWPTRGTVSAGQIGRRL